MALGNRQAKKLNELHSIREVIDYIDELEAKSYYVSGVFEPSDTLAHRKSVHLKDIPFLTKDDFNIKNFEKMIEKSKNLMEIGKFIERINSISEVTAEKLVPLVCKKINESENLRALMLCLNQIIGRNFSQRLTTTHNPYKFQDYNRIRLLAHILSGLDKTRLVNKLTQSNRLRDLWECLHTLNISHEELADQIIKSLDTEKIVEKLSKTRNPCNVGNLLRTIHEINSEKGNLILQEATEELRNSSNLTHIGTYLGGIAIFNIENAAALLPIIIDKMNSSNDLKEVGESFRKISLANRSIIPELFIGLNPDKQKHLQEKYGRYLKT